QLRIFDRLAIARQLDAPQASEIDRSGVRILEGTIGVVQSGRLGRGLGPLLRRLRHKAIGMPLPLQGEVGPVQGGGLQIERRRQSQPREIVHGPETVSRLQTWKDSPQPQRPFSFGFLNTKPALSFSSA